MVTMERRGRITYERLITSLGRVHGAIGAQLPDLKDAGRAQDLQQAIHDTLINARAGLSGEAVPSPAHLKQDLKAHIADVHNRHDALDAVKPHTQLSASTSPAATRKPNSLVSPQQPQAPKLPRGTRDTSKENAPPQPATRKLSAVKKTTISNRSTRTNTRTRTRTFTSPSTHPSGIKKRPARSQPPPKNDPTDDADRRAAATALLGLGLADQKHSNAFNSSIRSISITTATSTPSRTGVYEDTPFRADVCEDDTAQYADAAANAPQSREHERRSERGFRIPGLEVRIPGLEGVSVQRAFVMGVEYAYAHAHTVGRVGVEEQGEEWVRSGGVRIDDAGLTARGAGRRGRGFWDVV